MGRAEQTGFRAELAEDQGRPHETRRAQESRQREQRHRAAEETRRKGAFRAELGPDRPETAAHGTRGANSGGRSPFRPPPPPERAGQQHGGSAAQISGAEATGGTPSGPNSALKRPKRPPTARGARILQVGARFGTPRVRPASPEAARHGNEEVCCEPGPFHRGWGARARTFGLGTRAQARGEPCTATLRSVREALRSALRTLPATLRGVA